MADGTKETAPAAPKLSKVDAAVAAEREACAALIEAWKPGQRNSLYGAAYERVRKAMAADIRARG
jgi:hypothetical protein